MLNYHEFIILSFDYVKNDTYFDVNVKMTSLKSFIDLEFKFNMNRYNKTELRYNDIENYIENNFLKLIRLQKLNKINNEYENI